jgi:glutathione synthase/RimK-type ligase-like ATP-grasp enzyme
MANGPFLCQFIDEVKDLPMRQCADLKYFLTEELKVLSPHECFSDKVVLMLTKKLDHEADVIGRELIRRGIDYIRLNLDDIPNQLFIKYSIQQDYDSKVEFKVREQSTEPSKISVVWLRHFDIEAINVGYNELTHTFSSQQWNDACLTLQRSLRCEWINSTHGTKQAGDRAEQLSLAKALGFNIPNTLITNDPSTARDFYHTCNGDIIIKALHHHSVEIRDKVYSMYTHRVANEDLLRFDDLTYAPCILQERLHKQSDLRVTVVGDRIFATEIDSQSTKNGRDDMHRCPLKDLPKRAVKLDDTVGELCLKIINSLGLKYGAIDFVINKNSSLTFLEVNPTGDWYWIEYQTGQPITDAMVDLMEVLIKSPRSNSLSL